MSKSGADLLPAWAEQTDEGRIRCTVCGNEADELPVQHDCIYSNGLVADGGVDTDGTEHECAACSTQLPDPFEHGPLLSIEKVDVSVGVRHPETGRRGEVVGRVRVCDYDCRKEWVADEPKSECTRFRTAEIDYRAADHLTDPDFGDCPGCGTEGHGDKVLAHNQRWCPNEDCQVVSYWEVDDE